jgi:glycosyltransferase involved in cell wall biosynthesis
MRIDIVCSDGSPLRVTLATLLGNDPAQPGVGGSEYGLLTLCEAWTNAGHQVRLYNNPDIPGGSPFEQRKVNEFNPQDNRDVLIIFRSPNTRVTNAKGLKVWWSCDSHTTGSYQSFSSLVDKIVTISPHHSEFFKLTYGIMNTIDIDLPVRIWEYNQSIEKIPYRCIFTSVPDRGLAEMMLCWPQIVRRVPEATLVVTSDYRLWGCGAARNEHHLHPFIGNPSAKMLGAIKRPQLVEEEMKAELFVYPCTFDEQFCISASEAQIAGAYPITSDFGALPTTNMGTIIVGDPRDSMWREKFIEVVVENLLDRKGLKQKQHEIQRKALHRFSTERILEEWNKKIFDV